MKKTYIAPTVELDALSEGFQLCAGSDVNFGVSGDGHEGGDFGAKGSSAFDEYEDE